MQSDSEAEMPLPSDHPRGTVRNIRGGNGTVDLCEDGAPKGSLEPVGTDSGDLTVRRHMGGGVYRYIHSAVDPQREATMWADCHRAESDTAVILGCGLGYHLPAFVRRHRDVRQVYLVEADEPLFRLALEVSDLRAAAGDVSVHFLIGRDISSVWRILSGSLDGPFTYHLFLPAVSLHPEFYTAVIRILDERLRAARLESAGDHDCGRDGPFAAGVERLMDLMKNA